MGCVLLTEQLKTSRSFAPALMDCAMVKIGRFGSVLLMLSALPGRRPPLISWLTMLV